MNGGSCYSDEARKGFRCTANTHTHAPRCSLKLETAAVSDSLCVSPAAGVLWASPGSSVRWMWMIVWRTSVRMAPSVWTEWETTAASVRSPSQVSVSVASAGSCCVLLL